MRRLIIVLVVGSSWLGCGPSCSDPSTEASGVQSCAATGAPTGYCQCFVQYTLERYTCDDVNKSNVPISFLLEACNHCAPQYGGTCHQ